MEYEIGSEEHVSEAVVLAVSAVRGRDPISLPPLRGVIEPDSLDRIFETTFGGKPRKGGRVAFTYADCLVKVENGEFLDVTPIGAVADRAEPTD